jgi:hypothetical protein
MRNLLGIVAQEAIGVVASAAADADVNLELVLLPLACQGRTDMRLLGALAPSAPPAWLGRRALGNLGLGTHRYVGGGLAPVRSPLARLDGRVRHGFVVYDGGQA